MMLRTLLHWCFAAAFAASAVLCQNPAEVAKFATDSKKLVELKDDKGLDKLVKSSPTMASAVVSYFTSLRLDMRNNKPELKPLVDAINASWKRVYDGADTLDKLERWVEGLDTQSWTQFQKAQGNVQKAYAFFLESTKDNTKREGFEKAREVLSEAARIMESTGHKADAADAWYYVSLSLQKIPERTAQDREDNIAALEQFVSLREAWSYQDLYYVQIKNLLKASKDELEAKKKDTEKRASEGYTENAKGIDALVMPGVAEKDAPLQFAALASWEDDVDYSQRGGPVPAFWWYSAFGTDAKDAKLSWFRRQDLYFVRTAPNKFGITSLLSDASRTQPIEPSGKAKPVTFRLDAEKKVPYAMFFWTGSDREKLGEAEVNLAPSPQNTPIYYRSAASWTADIGGEQVTFYDDNASGRPMEGNPFEGDLKLGTIGFSKDDARSKAPLLDSMKVGKGPRVPFSEFVKVGAAWHYLHRIGDDKAGFRPLNPEYVKTGKVRLVWNGPKPTAPDQLVIGGRGDFRTANFDVAGGKEVEVPVGEYSVIYGRIYEGKGARAQMATIYGGDCKPFQVEAGKIVELRMGAPFALAFEAKVEGAKASIDGSRITVRETSGCVLAELHGWSAIPEVLAAKGEDGKGAKVVGRFVRFTDSDQLTALTSKLPDLGLIMGTMPVPQGQLDSMVLEVALPGEGMKVGLEVKKHPLFGRLVSPFQ